MRSFALLVLLAFAACRTAPIGGYAPVEPVVVLPTVPSGLPGPPTALPPEPPQPAPPLPTPVVAPRPVPAPLAGSASVMIQTLGNLRGPPGYMRYAGDVVAIDGVPFRAGRKTFRVGTGRHVITVAWQNYQVPDWVGVAYDGMSGVRFLSEGVSDVEIDVARNRYYEVKWPYDDEPGGPHGFRDVTMPRR